MTTSKNTNMAHIVNLMSIAGIDGNISEAERNIIIKIAQNLGLTEADFDACIEAYQHIDETKLETIVPEDDEDKFEFLKNMVLVMMVDGEIDENERAYIAGLAEKFGVDGDEAVDELIKIVYDEYFADDEDEEDEEDEEENEPGEDDEYEEEFDEEILNNADIDTRLFKFTPEQIADVKFMADSGSGEAQYVMGRYHLWVKPDDDSTDLAAEFFKSAAENGVGNAYAGLAQMLTFGYIDPEDFGDYDSLIEKGIEEGGMMALKMKLEDMIYGRHGYKSDPKKVIKFIEKDILGEDEDEVALNYPYFYVVLGDAYNKIGNKAKAVECYEQAVFSDMKEAAYQKNAVQLEGMNPLAKEMFESVIDMDCDDDVPGCFTLRAQLLGEKYEEQDNEERKETAKKIVEALEHDYKIGFGPAAARLGNIYYLGEYGLKRNMTYAWNWFYRGTLLEDADAFKGLAMMVKEGNSPHEVPEGFLEWCEDSAQRRGKGAPDMYFIAVIKPDGSTLAYRFIKDDWSKLAGYIGAKRLTPVRVDKLDEIGKKAGIDEHLTAWIDMEAPRKNMEINAVAKKFFNGVIAGDIILTLADNIWDPMLFLGVNDLKNIVKALGGKLVQIISDELALSKTKREYTKIDRDLLNSESGFVARIQPDNTAHIVNSGVKVFALFEEDLYDPIRLESLYKIGEKIGLKGRLTIWTDNSALRKQMIMNNKLDLNAIGTKILKGPVADNFFVAMEDANHNIILFDDVEDAEKAVIALGVKPENVIVD